MQIWKMSEEEAFAQLKNAGAALGIDFGMFEGKIRDVLLSIYMDGVFFRSPVQTIQSVDGTIMSAMNEQAAMAYILAKCRGLSIPVFLIQEKLTSVLAQLYRNGITLIVGPGALQNMAPPS